MTYKSIPSSNIVDMSPSAIRSPKTFVMGGSLKTLTQLIKSIFATGEQGFAYDPNDLTTMWQDQAKLLPVTGEGQLVWHILDKSGNNNHAFATSSATRPILQRNATTGSYYLAFDGADDFLKTNSIDFTATDKITTFSGFRKLSDTTTGIVCESNSFYIAAPNSGGAATIGGGFAVTTLRANVVSGMPAPISVVTTTKGNVSANISSIRVNGIDAGANTSPQGVGNYSNSAMYIGRRLGVAAAFNGHLYSLIGIGRLTTDSETIALEKAIAKNIGVTLNV